MSLKAFALLRSREDDPNTMELLPLAASFADEPSVLAAELLEARGALAKADPRGVFVLPEGGLAAARSATSYDEAIEAIGEAGMWIELDDASSPRPTQVDDLLAGMMGAVSELDPALLSTSVAALMGGLAPTGDDEGDDVEATNPGLPFDVSALLADPALAALAGQMSSALPEGGLEGMGALEKMGGLGALLQSPAFAAMLENASEILSKNPEQAAELAARLGFSAEGDDEDPDE